MTSRDWQNFSMQMIPFIADLERWVIVPLYQSRSWSHIPKYRWLDYHNDWYISWGQVTGNLHARIGAETVG